MGQERESMVLSVQETACPNRGGQISKNVVSVRWLVVCLLGV